MIFKVFILLPIFFITLFIKSVTVRKSGNMCDDQCYELTAVSSIIIILISYFLIKKKNKNILSPTIIVSFLFYLSNRLYFQSVANVTPMVETICCKTNTIVAFVLGFLFISKKMHYTQIIGLSFLILSYVMISRGHKRVGTQSNDFKNIVKLTASSCFEGLAFFFFDYFIQKKVVDFFHYAFLTQSINLAFNLCDLIFYLIKGTFNLFKYVTDFKYYILILSYTGISILWFGMSFTYELVPRMLITAVLYTVSDFVAEGVTNNWKYDNIRWYILCVVGILIYESKVIYKYFKKNK